MNEKSILTPGKELGKYRILSELGRGGMGCVYLALDQRLNRRVAIKAIWHHDSSDDTFVDKLAHEARVIANLSHPNVVHVHAFDVVDGIPVIEMEFIEGGSLAKRFRDEFVLPSEAVRHALGVSRALAYSHEQGAIHRDVKPSNILIDQHDHARLADFGIAKVLAESEMIALTNSRSSVFRGTPYYAPPEAWDGEEPSETWDLYSLGAVLYEAVSGTPPHVASTPLELAMKMATEPVEPIREVNPKISRELGELIDDLLTRNPDSRPSDAAEISERLEHVPEYKSDSAYDESTTVIRLKNRKRKKKKPILTRRNLVRMVGAACLIGAFALAIVVWEAATQRIWLDAFGASAGAPAAPPRAPVQDLNQLAADDGLSSLLHTRRNGVDSAAFDARLSSIQENMRWLVEMDDTPAPRRLVGFNDARLVALDFSPAEAAFAVEGNWAGYGDASGTVFRSGNVYGDAEWDDRTKVLLGTLVFVNDFDGATLESTIMATPSDSRMTDVQFAYEFEQSEFLTPLLFQELAPRDMEWASAFEALLPVYGNGASVARLANLAEETATRRVALDHSGWRRTIEKGEPLPEDVLLGLPRAAAPILRTSVSDEMLRLEIQAGIPESALPVHIELDVVRSFLVPIGQSPVFRLIHYPEDGSKLEYYGVEPPGALSSSSNVEWEFNAGSATIRVEVPFDVFALNPTAPKARERIRLGAAIISDQEANKGRIVAHWGFPWDGVAKHGAIVHFID